MAGGAELVMRRFGTGWLAGFSAAAVVVALACVVAFGAEETAGPPAESSLPQAGECFAQDDAAGQNVGGRGGARGEARRDERIRRWRALTPKKRRKLMELHHRYKKLPEKTRAGIDMRFEKWRRLSPEEKRRMRERLGRFRGLDERKRKGFRRRLTAWRSMSDERREFLRKALAVLKKLPPEKIEELKNMPPAQRRGALRAIFKEHGLEMPRGGRQKGRQGAERGQRPGVREGGGSKRRPEGDEGGG